MTDQSNNQNGDKPGLVTDGQLSRQTTNHSTTLSKLDQGLGLMQNDTIVGDRPIQQQQISSIDQQFRAGNLSVYGHSAAERQQSREFWETAAADARQRGDLRAAARATKLLHTFAEYDLKLLQEVDKASRLDEGTATENYSFGPVKFRGDRTIIDQDQGGG
jgi:hypothetical protein